MKSIITTTAAVAVTLSSAFTLGSAPAHAELANETCSHSGGTGARRLVAGHRGAFAERQAQGQVGPAGDRRPEARRGTIGVDVAAKSTDNHTLVIGFWPDGVWPFLYKKMPYDVSKDLVPIVITTTQPNVLAVNGNLPVKNVADFAYAKANPGKLSGPASATVSSSHLAMELFKPRYGIDAQHISFNSSPQPRCRRRTATRNWRCVGGFRHCAACAERQDSSDPRKTSKGRFESLKDLPSIASGIKDFEAVA